ncbi:MAG: class I SAM-dependent methyltransferase [Thermoanaerobaculia bacterium]
MASPKSREQRSSDSSPEIDLYGEPGLYDTLQQQRLDYRPAIQREIAAAVEFAAGRTTLSLADLCCGTGHQTKEIAERLGGLSVAVLVDTNQGFLDEAARIEIRAQRVDCLCGHVCDVTFESRADIVLASFAYHHVPDAMKARFIEQTKAALAPGGIVILGEIFLPDRVTTLRYYDHLYRSLPAASQTSTLRTFLDQTAASEDFEYKVTKSFADGQFIEAGLVRMTEEKIWPLDGSFDEDVGTFVQVYRRD